MKLQYFSIFLLLLVLAFSPLHAQKKDTLSFTSRSPVFNKARFWGVTGGILGIYEGSLVVLSQIWYKDYPRSRFHFFNDGREWLGIDKAGHAFSSYFISRWSVGMYRWTGIEEKKAIWLGGMMGTFLMSSVEIMDGFSSKWGFSGYDFLANMSGSALVIAQELAWKEQRIVMKMSFWPTYYKGDEVKARADNLFGSSPLEKMLKDYNATTIWLSANVHSFIKRETKFPFWLNVSFGYGANGMLGGFVNRWCNDPFSAGYGNCPAGHQVDRSDIQRYPQFYVSFDIDWTKIPTKKPGVKVLFNLLNLVKLPFPTFEFNPIDKFKFHPLFF